MAKEKKEKTETKGPPKKRILIVEDEGITAMDLRMRLEALGYEVVGHADTGEGAVKLAEEHKPDLVLMDIMLKGEMDGIQAAEQIRPALGIPIIFLTAYADNTTLRRAKVTEPYGYILKPFEERELHTNIEVALYKHSAERRLRDSEERLAITLGSITDAVVATDENSRIAFINPAAERLTGWERDEVLGKKPPAIIVLEDEGTRKPLTCPVALTYERNEGISYDRDALLVTKDDGRIPISLSTAFIRDEGDKVAGVVIVFRDVTQRQNTEELMKREARSEVFSLLASALLVFASGVPPKARDMLVGNFADRFERNMRPRFDVHLGRMRRSPYSKMSKPEDTELVLSAFFSWLDELYHGLGSHMHRDGEAPRQTLTIPSCPWLDEAKGSPMFCNICRAMVTRAFGWTGIPGQVNTIGTIAQGATTCRFDIRIKGK